MQSDNSLKRFIELQRKLNRHERYQQERDINHGVTSLNDSTAFDIKETVEYVLMERQIKSALWYALSRLDSVEYDIVEEYFFLREKKDTLEALGKKHGISRQAYKSRLNRILHKLYNLMKEHSDEVGELYDSLIL